MLNSRLFLILSILLLSYAHGMTQSYLVRNVTVIPMNKEVSLENQDVLIQDGIIKKVARSAKTKAGNGVTEIDGTGKYLIPGLFDMHTHFFYEQGENKNTCDAEL